MALAGLLLLVAVAGLGGFGGFVYGKRVGFKNAKERFRREDLLQETSTEQLLAEIGNREVERLPESKGR